MTDVNSLTQVIDGMGNPFLETGPDLLVLDNRDLAHPAVVNSVRRIEALGSEQYEMFKKERLIECTVPITDTLSKNKLPLFRSPPPKMQSKHKFQLASLKSDCSLFSRLYISCQTREGDLDNFFSHENQPVPPSLSQGGALRQGTKSDLVHCLTSVDDSVSETTIGHVDAVVIDGAAAVHMLKPGTVKTFQDYADNVFVPYITSQLKDTKRVDIVWDVYQTNSLKAIVRQMRGKGTRRRVEPCTHIPRNWKDFLC